MKIKGFWHIYCVNHWYSIVTDQLRILLTSGLYDACEEISIGCLGSDVERGLLQKLVVGLYPKLKIKYASVDSNKYEYETLKLIEADVGDYAGFYFHTKGVTKPSDTIVNHWRVWLNEAILNRWSEHYLKIVDIVDGGYDVSSVNHCLPPLHPEHFSGNFWWFNREYINKLPMIDSLNWKHRWNAEQWVCKGGGKYYSTLFVEPGRDVYLMMY